MKSAELSGISGLQIAPLSTKEMMDGVDSDDGSDWVINWCARRAWIEWKWIHQVSIQVDINYFMF